MYQKQSGNIVPVKSIPNCWERKRERRKERGRNEERKEGKRDREKERERERKEERKREEKRREGRNQEKVLSFYKRRVDRHPILAHPER